MDPNQNIPTPPDLDPASIFALLITAIILIIPFWRIFSKAGYSDMETFEEYDKGWLCVTGKRPS